MRKHKIDEGKTTTQRLNLKSNIYVLSHERTQLEDFNSHFFSNFLILKYTEQKQKKWQQSLFYSVIVLLRKYKRELRNKNFLISNIFKSAYIRNKYDDENWKLYKEYN